jgi:hypothetical protein
VVSTSHSVHVCDDPTTILFVGAAKLQPVISQRVELLKSVVHEIFILVPAEYVGVLPDGTVKAPS